MNWVCYLLGGLDGLLPVEVVGTIGATVGVGDGVVVLAAELLKCLASSFRNEQCSEATEQHEESVNLQDVVHPILAIVRLQSRNGTLANDGTNLARGGRDTVGGRTVSGWEYFAGNNEGRGVGAWQNVSNLRYSCSSKALITRQSIRLTKVEEELSKDINSQQAVGRDVVVSKTHDDEQNGEDDEATKLDSFAAKGVDGGDRDPVPWHSTSQNNNQVTNSGIVQELVHVGDGLAAGGETNGLENLSVVQRETVESDIEAEPGTSSPEQEKKVLGLGIVARKVTPAGLGDLEVVLGLLSHGGAGDLVRLAFMLSGHVSLDIVAGLFDIASNIEGITRGFWDGETDYKNIGLASYHGAATACLPG